MLHGDAPTKVGDTTVYDHSFLTTTLTNPSAREVEIVSVMLTSDGTSGRSGLGDIKDYWHYPAGSHRLRPGESLPFDKTGGFTEKTDHQQLRYAFDVCWKADGNRQCRDYHVDLFPPIDVVGLADPEALASAAKLTNAVLDRAKRTAPELAARLELLAILRSRRFGELTQRVEAAQAAFEADPRREEQVSQMWDTFATSDPSLTPFLEAWVAAADSYAPRVALGIHYRRSGWEARGTRVGSKTSRDRFNAMDEHFEQARKNLHRALELHPRLAVAFENLISIEKSGSPTTESHRLVEGAARACPSCVGPPFEYLIGLNPRWGGSHEEMERYLAELAPRIEKNPRLAILRGAVAADRGASARYRNDYEAALRLYDEALADLEFWLVHGVRTAEALLWKTYALGKLHRFAEAVDAIDLARRLEPTDAKILELANYYGVGAGAGNRAAR